MSEEGAGGDLPRPTPTVTPETESFWAATDRGRLSLGRCGACEEVFYPPRSRCPTCLSAEAEEIEAAGRGTVYSYSIVRQSEGTYADAVPYVLAYVELEEGPRIMTNIVDTPVEAVAVGQAVAVVFEDAGDGRALPRFAPVE